jgi:hypothetical protein
MDAPELFPGDHEVREEASRADWSPSVGNGWAAIFVSPEDEGLTLSGPRSKGRSRAHGSPPRTSAPPGCALSTRPSASP